MESLPPPEPEYLPPEPPEPPAAEPERSGLAVASLLLGLAGVALCVVGPLVGIPAIICGHKAKADIRNSGGALVGKGLATIGLIAGYFATFFVFVAVFGAVVVYPQIDRHLKASRATAQTTTCRANLEAIQCAKEQWALTFNKSVTTFPREFDLYGPGKPLETPARCPAGGYYTLNPVRDSPRCSIHGTIRW